MCSSNDQYARRISTSHYNSILIFNLANVIHAVNILDIFQSVIALVILFFNIDKNAEIV